MIHPETFHQQHDNNKSLDKYNTVICWWLSGGFKNESNFKDIKIKELNMSCTELTYSNPSWRYFAICKIDRKQFLDKMLLLETIVA